MTQDFAKPSTTRKPAKARSKAKPKAKHTRKVPPPKKQTPPPRRGKLIFTLVLLVSAFSYALYYLQSIPPTNTPTDKKKTKAGIASPPKIDKPSTKEQPDQRFKFYEILPESKIIPPKVESYRYKEKTQSDKYYYLVQTGSFRNLKDAERQKATIAFQGLKADIRSIDNGSGNIWYRVMTGPFYNRSQMNSALDKLVTINIEPLVKKVKTDP